MERGTFRVKCVIQQHKTMSLGRTGSQSAQFRSRRHTHPELNHLVALPCWKLRQERQRKNAEVFKRSKEGLLVCINFANHFCKYYLTSTWLGRQIDFVDSAATLPLSKFLIKLVLIFENWSLNFPFKSSIFEEPQIVIETTITLFQNMPHTSQYEKNET